MYKHAARWQKAAGLWPHTVFLFNKMELQHFSSPIPAKQQVVDENITML